MHSRRYSFTHQCIVGLLSVAAFICLNSLMVGAHASDGAKPLKNNLLLQNTSLPSSEFSTKVRTITWPVGYTSKVHSHAGPGPRYVLRGTVQITENGQSSEYSAGEVFWYSAKYPHQAKNVDSVETQVLIIELLPHE